MEIFTLSSKKWEASGKLGQSFQVKSSTKYEQFRRSPLIENLPQWDKELSSSKIEKKQPFKKIGGQNLENWRCNKRKLQVQQKMMSIQWWFRPPTQAYEKWFRIFQLRLLDHPEKQQYSKSYRGRKPELKTKNPISSMPRGVPVTQGQIRKVGRFSSLFNTKVCQ